MALLVRVNGRDGVSAWRLLGTSDRVWSERPPGRLLLCTNDVTGLYGYNSGALIVTLHDIT